MWRCLEELPADQGIVAELERRVAAATAALGVLERRFAAAGAGSLAAAAAARATLHAVVSAIDRRDLRDVSVAVEHLAAGMRALDAALDVARRLRDGSAPD